MGKRKERKEGRKGNDLPVGQREDSIKSIRLYLDIEKEHHVRLLTRPVNSAGPLNQNSILIQSKQQ